MPITKNVKKNFHELYADNKKKGKAKGAGGKARSRKQIIAIALSKSGKGKKKVVVKKSVGYHKMPNGKMMKNSSMKMKA